HAAHNGTDVACATPVFPAMVTSEDLALLAVPSVTTPASAFRIIASVSGLMLSRLSGTLGNSSTRPVARSITALTSLGRTGTPLLATVAVREAIWIGVTVTYPWPIEAEIVSPGNHCSLRTFCFQSVDGTIPSRSDGSS